MNQFNPDIPEVLYKYRSLSCPYTKCMLAHGEIYFASLDELNDPFEYFFEFEKDGWMTISEKTVIELNLQPIDRNVNGGIKLSKQDKTTYFLSSIRKDKDRGIFSLCENEKQISMYSYYADSFKGICIGFNWKEFGLKVDGSNPTQDNIPRKVDYLSNPHIISKPHVAPNQWFQIFTTKSNDFAFEKEWRMFYAQGAWSSPNVRKAIREIIFGHRVSEENKAKVKEWIQDLPDVELFVAKPIIGKFELEIVPYSTNNIEKISAQTSLSREQNHVSV